MKVYHLTISHQFEARDYSDEDLFEVLHQVGDVFVSLEVAKTSALEDAQKVIDSTYVEGRPRLEAAIDWDEMPAGTWTGHLPGYEDHEWLAVVNEAEVRD